MTTDVTKGEMGNNHPGQKSYSQKYGEEPKSENAVMLML